MKLSCKTNAGSSPQGKPKVYFTSHPEDFKGYFPEISTEILKIQNCALLYRSEGADAKVDFDLSQMQLMVVPVTYRLLKDGTEALSELQFAREHGIPVLPIMVETGLEELFNARFSGIQLLDRCNQDPTAISYEEKLRKFLGQVLVNDEQASRIRGAFNGRIFLSYRKSDRRLAQKLMELIHAHAGHRAVSIWYDEYLNPGEEFNDAIRKEIREADVFAMAVTENLVKEDNYVWKNEYPEAKQLKIPILPIRMEQVDPCQLAKWDEEMPESVDATDETGTDSLAAELGKYVPEDENQDPHHRFLLGLAYLQGVDVEVDRARGFAMILEAAENGCLEAMEKLVELYSVGIGVDVNENEAIKWCRRKTEITRKAYETAPSDETAVPYGGALWKEGALYTQVLDFQKAEKNLRDFRKLIEAHPGADQNHLLQYSLLNLGICYLHQQRLEEAKESIEKAKAMLPQCVDAQSENLAAEVTCFLGWVLSDLGDVPSARACMEEALGYYEKIANRTGADSDLRSFAGMHLRLARLEEKDERLPEAIGHLRQGLEILKRSSRYVPFETEEERECNRVLGILYMKQGKYPEALDILMPLNAVLEELISKTGRLSLRLRQVELDENIGYVYTYRAASEAYPVDAGTGKASGVSVGALQKEDWKQAREWFGKACEQAEEIVAEAPTMDARNVLCGCHQGAGTQAYYRHDLEESARHFDRMVEISRQIAEEQRNPVTLRHYSVALHDRAMVHRSAGETQQALELHRKANVIAGILFRETGTMESTMDYYTSEDELGEALRNSGAAAEAKEHLENALELAKRIQQERDGIDARWNVGRSFRALSIWHSRYGSVRDASAYAEKAQKIFRELSKETNLLEVKKDLAGSWYSIAQCARRRHRYGTYLIYTVKEWGMSFYLSLAAPNHLFEELDS